MKIQKYIPISCNFHDILLDRATRKIVVKIEYYNTLNEVVQVRSVIVDVYTSKESEYLKTRENLVIRLDQLREVDGIKLPEKDNCELKE